MNKKDFIKWKEKLTHVKKEQWVVVFLIGLLLLVISLPTGKQEASDSLTATTQTQNTDAVSQTSSEQYEEQLERRLAEILSKMDGVGKVEVMITLSDNGEEVIGKDTETTNNVTSEEADGTKRNSTDSSTKPETVYVDEDGNTYPYVVSSLTPEVEGVLVVCDGGDNSVVASNISDAVMALFQIEIHKIKVVKRTTQGENP